MADKVYVLKAESLSTSLGHGAKVNILQKVMAGNLPYWLVFSRMRSKCTEIGRKVQKCSRIRVTHSILKGSPTPPYHFSSYTKSPTRRVILLGYLGTCVLIFFLISLVYLQIILNFVGGNYKSKNDRNESQGVAH